MHNQIDHKIHGKAYLAWFDLYHVVKCSSTSQIFRPIVSSRHEQESIWAIGCIEIGIISFCIEGILDMTISSLPPINYDANTLESDEPPSTSPI